jgi:hypothetical protein
VPQRHVDGGEVGLVSAIVAVEEEAFKFEGEMQAFGFEQERGPADGRAANTTPVSFGEGIQSVRAFEGGLGKVSASGRGIWILRLVVSSW